MYLLLAVLVGALFASGTYLVLQRQLVRLVLGVAMLGHGANLLIFAAGGLVRGEAPLVPAGSADTLPAAADPLPQALVLTAIVISFAVLAFGGVLVKRTVEACGADDADMLVVEA